MKLSLNFILVAFLPAAAAVSPTTAGNETPKEINIIELPSFAEELASLRASDPLLGEDAEALLLHDLLIKGAEAEHSLEESLELIGVAPDEMEFIFIDYEDLAEDLMDTFDDYEDLAEDLIDTFDELEEEEEIPTLTEAMEHLEAVDPFLAEDTKALVLHDLLIKGAEAEHSLEESLALIAVDRDEMESIFSEHYSLAKDVMDAFDELKEEEKLPTLAEAMEQLEALDLHHGKDTEALVLHDLLLKGSAVQFSLEGALELINVDYDEMESIFTDHDDLAEDVLDAYIDLENENAEIGAQVVRYLEEHIIQDEDGNLLFQGSGEDPVNEHQEHHRRLEHLRNLRWEKYYSEREMLPKKLKEHGAFLKRHLADLSGCDDQDEAMCFSEELEIYEEEIEELVLVMEDELGPFMDVMGALDKAVGSVKSVASVIGTLETICKVLKLLPGFFGTLFNLAYNFFTTLDKLADPVEQALDDFQDAVLKVWERTAGTAFDLMVKFEDGFGAAVGVFSIAAVAPKMQAVPEVFKHLTTLDLADFKNAVMFASEHIKNIVQLGSSLMSAFASDVFDFFRNAAEGFIDAIMEVDVVMKLFKALETAYTTKITLPFGMPRTLQSKNFGRASCSAYENKYKRTNRYSGYKKFDILTPYYNNCKEKCPSTYDAVTGGKKCRAKCSHYGLSPHNILGIQEGCKKKSVKRPLKSLTITKKCDKKYGSSWYRSIPTDKCRQKCHSWKKNTFYGETYSYCTYKCPSGMSDKKNFKDKACTIPDSGKFDRSVMKASCSKYVTSSTPTLFLKDTGGCFEDCKSTEHSFRALFFCVDKQNLKISVKDVVDFISNVLDKITSLPGVGDILGAIDKLIAPLLDFVEDLLPKDALFPSIDFPIDVSDLDFGAVTDVFNNINLPELPSFDNVLDNIASKFDVDFSNAPLGEIFDFFDGIGDTVTTFGEKIEVAAERIGGVFDSIEEAEILSCAKWGEKSIPCSTAFAFIGMNDADCTIDIPWCEELNMTGLTSALEGIGDVFDGIIDVFKKDEERRKLTDFRDEEAFGGWGWFRTGDFTKIMTLECSFSSAAPFSCGLQDVFSGTDIYKTSFGRKDSLFNWMDWSSYQPKVSSGFKFSVKPITLTLDLGIFISNCGKWKFAFETSFSSSLEFAITVGEKKWLKDSIKIYGDYDPTKSSNELTKKAAQCFGFESLDDVDQNSWNQIKHHCIEFWVIDDEDELEIDSGLKIELPEEEREKRDICKGVCKAWEKVKTDYGKTECSKTDMEDLINQVEGTTGVSKTTTDKIAKCINEWKQFKKNVDDELRLFSPRLAGGKSGLPKFLSDWWHSELGEKLDVFKVPLPGVIFHADDKDEFENGLQIGVGLNLGDRGTKLGVELWWCATCQSAEPYKMDTGSVGVGHVFDLLRAMIKDLPAAGSAAGSASSSLASGMQSAIKSAFDKIAVIDWPQTPVGRKAMELPSGDGQRGRNTGETIDFLKEMALKLDMTLKFSFGKISLGKPARVETGIFKDDEEVCD